MEFKKKHVKTAVVACIIDDQERVLLTRRCIEPFCDDWVMPGGKIDHGEAILAALHREVEEEVGIKVQVEGLIDRALRGGCALGADRCRWSDLATCHAVVEIVDTDNCHVDITACSMDQVVSADG